MLQLTYFQFKVTNKNYVRFLSGWQQENKPHALLFGQTPAVPLMYKVMDLGSSFQSFWWGPALHQSPKPACPWDNYIFEHF
jgi:hypothetical protein